MLTCRWRRSSVRPECLGRAGPPRRPPRLNPRPVPTRRQRHSKLLPKCHDGTLPWYGCSYHPQTGNSGSKLECLYNRTGRARLNEQASVHPFPSLASPKLAGPRLLRAYKICRHKGFLVPRPGCPSRVRVGGEGEAQAPRGWCRGRLARVGPPWYDLVTVAFYDCATTYRSLIRSSS